MSADSAPAFEVSTIKPALPDRGLSILYGRAKAAFIGWTTGVNHSTQGAETVNAINNLALLTGQLG
jgi:assimilatory nitrate reductase catalytic subunit